MAEIYVTPELLKGKAKELRGYKSEHDDAINRIKNLVNGLTGEFKGVAANAYIEKFNSMEPTFNNFSEMLAELASNLDFTADELERKDNEVASKIGG